MLAKNKYTPIIGTLGYILNPAKDQVLLVHRNARKDDDNLGKYMGLGGKMERNEDVYTCMQREIKEEAGIDVTEMEFRGTINWTSFGPKGEDWLGFIFLITRFEGEPWEECPEGKLEWVPLDRMDTLPMWEGDKHFLPLIFDKNQKPFHGYMPYDKQLPIGWNFCRQ